MVMVMSGGIGLSPRVRGNRSHHHPHRCWDRSIPACAGEPKRNLEKGNLLGVYPRVCGGTRPGKRESGFQRGLSPRVRGNLRRIPQGQLIIGSIPACAGEPVDPDFDREDT